MVDSRLFSLESMGAHPRMCEGSVVQGDRWRIGILTDALIRFEWSDTGVFVDDATTMAINRRFEPVPDYTVTHNDDGSLEIETSELRIFYDGQPFSPEGLYIYMKHSGAQESTWHYGDEQKGNLGGTTRTLDQIDGSTALDPGLISKYGWAVIDDSRTSLIRKADQVGGKPNPFGTWVFPKEGPSQDWYFFGYNQKITEAVKDFYHLSGHTPLLPRYVLGNWWSRYHRYSQDEYEQLMERFNHEGIPFTVAVIDMDWHLVDIDPNLGSGWTGYTWNKELFPNPKDFLHWLHDHGMRTTLSLHPRDGVRSFEEPYERVARAAGIDPASKKTVEFDVTSPVSMNAYFDALLHPMEEQGVDFWWIDWQQGSVAKQKDLDPLWLLNHLHYLDSAHMPGHRPLTFSRYAGPGSHRYPVGFSGDTVVSWKSLRFQPYFTAMASNIGYGWWSHDIGGHMFGYRDEELEARWYQLGTFSPINRLHSSSSPFNGKEPWNFRVDVAQSMVGALRLRHALIPYLYSMNRRAAYEDLPLVEPMYWHYSGGNVPTQFMFGTELIVSPILEPADRALQKAKAQVWFPHGLWFDWFDGRHYDAEQKNGRNMEVWRGLDRMPVFAKAGGIVPLQSHNDHRGQNDNEYDYSLNTVENPQGLDLRIFPGDDGHFTLWEDDGAPQGRITWVRTDLDLNWKEGKFTISPAQVCPEEGAAEVSSDPGLVVPKRRDWTLTFRGLAPVDASRITALSDGQVVPFSCTYDEERLSLIVSLRSLSCTSQIDLVFNDRPQVAHNPMNHDALQLLQGAQMFYFTKEQAWDQVRNLGVKAVSALHTLEMPPGDYGEPSWFQSHMPQEVIRGLEEIFLRDQ